ncbi:cytochrome c3 family protein [Candidatus Poribacteria bacterium]|nr:cytochrome c3 family protein [Candidatus Poribacteria bacterium]
MRSNHHAATSICLFMAALLFSHTAFAGTVFGSKHDLSTTGGITNKSTNETQVCIFCHTPHSARPSVPLWNRVISSSSMSYTLYSSPTLNASPAFQDTGSPGSSELLGGPSRLCLSCHDGTISVSNIINRFPDDQDPLMGSGTELDLDGSLRESRLSNLGGATLGGSVADLSNDHPISFEYSSQLASADGEIYDPADPAHSEIQQLLKNYSGGRGNFECSSCHDPHNPDFKPFLVKNNNMSALCLTCHIK